jgi:hypothetical protein
VQLNEEELSSSSYYGPAYFAALLVGWAAVTVATVVGFVRIARIGGGNRALPAAWLSTPWIAISIWLVRLITREPHRITLRGDILRVYRGFGFTDIPLWRVRHVEHDFLGRGPRRVMLAVEPELAGDPVLEAIEFVPQGGDLGVGGKEIADELRRRVVKARAARAATLAATGST